VIQTVSQLPVLNSLVVIPNHQLQDSHRQIALIASNQGPVHHSQQH
jgi:hypothetical protein